MMRKLCASYWVLLTLVLLARNPLNWFSSPAVHRGYDQFEPAAHFVCFAVLGLLVFATRLPLGRAWLIVLLVGYSVATELLQDLVPGRTPELRDFVQDIAGLAAGAALYFASVYGWRRLMPETTQPAEDWHLPRRRLPAAVVKSSSERL